MTDNGSQSGLGGLPSDRRRRKQALFQKHQASKQSNQEGDEFSNSKSSLQEDPVQPLGSSSTKIPTQEKQEKDQVEDSTPGNSRSGRGSPDRKSIIKKKLAEKRNSRLGRIDNRDSDDHTSEEDGGNDQISEPATEKSNSASQSDQIKKLPRSGRRRSPGKKGKIMQQLAEKKRFSQKKSNESYLSANDDSDGQSENTNEYEDPIEEKGTLSANDDSGGPSEKTNEYEDRIEEQEEQIRPSEDTTSQGESDISTNEEKKTPLVEENSAAEDGRTTPSEVYCNENGVSKSSFEEEEKRLTEGLLGRELSQLDQSTPVQNEASVSPKLNAQSILHEPEAPHALELMQPASKDDFGSLDTQIQDLSRTLAHSLLADKGAESGVPKDDMVKGRSQSIDEELQEEGFKNSQPYDKNRWDTRSILEYPPDPPPIEEKTAETDPSWTTFNSAFDTEVKEMKHGDELDSEVGLAADIENEFRGDADWSNVNENHCRSVENKSTLHTSLSDNNSEKIVEEKISWDASTALFDPKLSPRKTSDVHTDAAVDMFDTKSWVVSEASSSNNILDGDKTNELPEEEKSKASRPQKDRPYPEDAPLLAQDQFRSEQDNFGEGITIDKNAGEGALCQLERLAIYNQNNGDQSSVENNEEDEISIDEKSEASEPDEIQYVAADDEDFVLFAEENMEPKSAGPSNVDLVEPAPMFEPANVAADKAESNGNNDDSSSGYYNFDPTSGDSLMTTSSLKGDDSTAYSSLAGEAYAHNGMSVNSTSSSVETNQNKASTKNSLEKYSSVKARFSIPSSKKKESYGNVVPLIPPPPDDKLRKWEQSKQRSSMVLVSSKPDETSIKGDAAQTENSFVLAEEVNGSPKKRDGSKLESKTGQSPSAVVENEGNGSLLSPTLSDIVSIVAMPSPMKKRSDESCSSPVHPSPEMASKFATATSVAAKTFEQKYLSLNEEDTGKSQDESVEVQNDGISSLFCAPYTIADTAASMSDNDAQVSSESNEAVLPSSPQKGVSKANDNESPSRDAGVDLVGGAFNCWNGNLDTSATTEMPEVEVDDSSEETTDAKNNSTLDNSDLVSWLEKDVLGAVPSSREAEESTTGFSNDRIRTLLENDENLNSMCIFVADKVNERTKTKEKPASTTEISVMSSSSSNVGNRSPKTDLHPFQLFGQTNKGPTGSQIQAANFVSFLQRIANLIELKSPFGDENPFMLHVVGASLKLPIDEKKEKDICEIEKKMQTLVFDHPNGDATSILIFFYNACFFHDSDFTKDNLAELPSRTVPIVHEVSTSSSKISLDTFDDGEQNRNLIVPDQDICPFELAMCDSPSILLVILAFLGDPQAVCRMKQVNLFCNQIISENEHMVFRDAVRIGGLSMHLRPAFWIWVTLEKFGNNRETSEKSSPEGSEKADKLDIHKLENIGQEGQWHSVISRDVSRAFGNMPPHKTGAHARDDSIVRALVTWGQNRLMKRGVKGGGEADPIPTVQSNGGEPSRPRPVRQTTAPPPWETGDDDSNSDVSLTPTVSDWSAISPVGSFNSHFSIVDDKRLAKQHSELSRNEKKKVHRSQRKFAKELALSGNALNNDMKIDLQNKLGFILHALAAAHDNVGYCQGMDYVVAHLLRVLQETIVWQARRGALSSTISSAKKGERMSRKAVEDSCVVEETVFRVMNSLLTTYNLRHMYWPELRCLKTVCRVFEKLIQLKLPVLADHFDHHELNIGMFALGWFQTLFLYLPSMPAKTVCHMWDIWLVERSFKIFFRVGTAILFLSQPILLNHELEGMMTYLNTFPDATLLRPDILIACALQIKVTNKMLLQLEKEVTGGI